MVMLRVEDVRLGAIANDGVIDFSPGGNVGNTAIRVPKPRT